ncbi:MAG: barstar family protein [Lachnospiraceae bacterium]|nr:barstar family protein [Lachnospiraceae bacterium]
MRKMTIDLRYAQNKEELHEGLAATSVFPDYYGRNLDALYDVLTDISEDTCMLVMLPSSAVLTEEELSLLDPEPEEDDWNEDDADDEDEEWDEDDVAEWHEFLDYLDRMRDTFLDAEKSNPHLCVFVP